MDIGKGWRFGKGFVVLTNNMPGDYADQIVIVEESGWRRNTGNSLLVIWSGELPYDGNFLLQSYAGARFEAYFFGSCYVWDGGQKEGELSKQIEIFNKEDLLIYLPKTGGFYNIKKKKFQVADPEKWGKDIDNKLHAYAHNKEE